MYEIQTKAWMITFLFKEWFCLFKKLILSGISLINRQLLVLDKHGFHATLEVIEQTIFLN
jgi:hypothetical protein